MIFFFPLLILYLQVLEDFTTAHIHTYHGPPHSIFKRLWNSTKMIQVCNMYTLILNCIFMGVGVDGGGRREGSVAVF